MKNAPSALGQKNDLIAWIPLEREQMNLYTKFLASKPVRDAANKTGSAISCMNMLKKICDHPSLCVGGAPVEDIADDQLDDVDGDDAELKKSCAGEAAAAVAACVRECKFDADVLERGAPSVSSKSKFLMAMLERFGAEGHRTLVFSQSQAMLDIIEANVRATNIDCVRIDGKVNVEERDRRVTEFRSRDDIPVMLLTARVGGLGLTLTEATRVIIYDPAARNPTTDNQSVFRAYRIGQTKDVVVYRLITCGTVEDKIYRRQVFKGGLSKAGAEGGNSTRYFGAEEASQLFETSETALRTSDTMKTLNALHADRKWTDELRKELPFVEALPFVCGVSDHDLLFSKDDEVSSNKASASSNKAATSKQANAGGATTPKVRHPRVRGRT